MGPNVAYTRIGQGQLVPINDELVVSPGVPAQGTMDVKPNHYAHIEAHDPHVSGGR